MRERRLRRRELLAGGAAVGAASLTGCLDTLGGGDGAPATERVEGERARTLAEAHAPELYFGVGERWFPTDPRAYAGDYGDESVLDGFAAVDGYARDYDPSGEPPHRTVFYNVVQYAGTDLVVVQYWLYSAFDQFTTNFHWHDWELLQVFLDVSEDSGDPDGGAPTLFVASAHARSVPNNEFLDPGTGRASVISEVGSHSSALSVNETPAAFERLPVPTDIADISNGVLALADIPAAYGLPRGEGFRLPFSLPELDGAPIHEHPDLPNVTRDHLVPASMTIDSVAGLPSPPADLPLRETGLRLAHEGSPTAAEADYAYALVPMGALTVEEFTGPQLSFEFAVPRFAEDAVASHLTTTGTPTAQPRYTNPIADVTDPRHRAALSERFDVDVTGLAGDVVGLLRDATGTAEAPGSNGIETTEPSVERLALLESDLVVAPTFNGVVALRDVPEGEHRLTVNGAGVAPYAQRVAHEAGDEPTTVGVGGDVVQPPAADAVKLRASPAADAPGFERVAVADDFAGGVFDGPPPVADAAGVAVYVHREGAYTAEVEDGDGRIGAFRVNPGADQSTATVRGAATGKASLTSYLLTLLVETTAQATAFADGDADGIDDVGVPDSTAEQPGEAAAVVEDVLAAAAEAAGDSDDDGGDGSTEAGDSGGAGGPGGGGQGGSGLTGLLRALSATTTAAERADEAAQAGDAAAADSRLRGLRQRTDALTDAIERNRDRLPGRLPALVERRLPQVNERIDQALAAGE
ncbi:hypothetical protein [Halobaculum gomorrense]|uniref:Uncharacterized protein n=1 Tax=Halobaculum gomorrense TaxID=43928 RepID=A0A1M5TRE0_9EURY|nr:hypothetical protein [Halobaculum gomorrense]SHH52963.1 hypothetical protein SAMN05443636_2803 [Halobaculum gomorrense]